MLPSNQLLFVHSAARFVGEENTTHLVTTLLN